MQSTMDNILAQANWEDYFGSSTRVYENKHPFPGLLINYNDETDEDERDPAWLSQMFESGFIRLIQLTSHDQISLITLSWLGLFGKGAAGFFASSSSFWTTMSKALLSLEWLGLVCLVVGNLTRGFSRT